MTEFQSRNFSNTHCFSDLHFLTLMLSVFHHPNPCCLSLGQIFFLSLCVCIPFLFSIFFHFHQFCNTECKECTDWHLNKHLVFLRDSELSWAFSARICILDDGLWMSLFCVIVTILVVGEGCIEWASVLRCLKKIRDQDQGTEVHPDPSIQRRKSKSLWKWSPFILYYWKCHFVENDTPESCWNSVKAIIPLSSVFYCLTREMVQRKNIKSGWQVF